MSASNSFEEWLDGEPEETVSGREVWTAMSVRIAKLETETDRLRDNAQQWKRAFDVERERTTELERERDEWKRFAQPWIDANGVYHRHEGIDFPSSDACPFCQIQNVVDERNQERSWREDLLSKTIPNLEMRVRERDKRIAKLERELADLRADLELAADTEYMKELHALTQRLQKSIEELQRELEAREMEVQSMHTDLAEVRRLCEKLRDDTLGTTAWLRDEARLLAEQLKADNIGLCEKLGEMQTKLDEARRVAKWLVEEPVEDPTTPLPWEESE